MDKYKIFNNKTVLITGGTGSFGTTFLKRLSNDFLFKEVRIFSRDEKKQDDLRKIINNKKVKFIIGDVRDPISIDYAVNGCDYIFHAAALKQVPSCEFFPVEAVKTNILGTNNVLISAEKYNVKKVLVLSTDKASYPINAMGMSKALMEKIAISKARKLNNSSTIFNVTRYGNVMGSRGSVIPLFINQIKEGKDLTITNPNMTRFMMSLDDAINLVVFAFNNGNQGDLFVQKSPAATIETLAKALIEIYKSKSKIKTIGTRHGEKIHETLVTKEDMLKAEDLGNYYRVTIDDRNLNYPDYASSAEILDYEIDEYNSSNTVMLNVEEMKNILLKLPFIREDIAYKILLVMIIK